MIMGSPPPRYLVPCTPQLLTLTGQSCMDLDPWGHVPGVNLGHPEFDHFHSVGQSHATATSGPVYSANHHGADLLAVSPVIPFPENLAPHAGTSPRARAVAGDTRPGESTGRHALTERITMADDPQPCPGGHPCPDPENHVDGFPCAPATAEPPGDLPGDLPFGRMCGLPVAGTGDGVCALEHGHRELCGLDGRVTYPVAARDLRAPATAEPVRVCGKYVPGTGPGGLCMRPWGHGVEPCTDEPTPATPEPAAPAVDATEYHAFTADALDPAHRLPSSREPGKGYVGELLYDAAGATLPDDYVTQNLPEILRRLDAAVGERVDEHESLRHQTGLALAREDQQRRAVAEIARKADRRSQDVESRLTELDPREWPMPAEVLELEQGRDPWRVAQAVALVILAACAVVAVVGGLLF